MDTQNISSGEEKEEIKPVSGKKSGKRKVQPKKRKLKAECWKHFQEFYDEEGHRKGICNYCGNVLCAESSTNGTSSLNKHVKSCEKNPANINKDQTRLSLKKNEDGQSTLKTWKFDPANVRRALIRMIIEDELPFSFVEREGFRNFMEAVCPSFNIPSRFTVARDIVEFYLDGKKKLKQFFIKNKHRVSFTTDTWTSNQNINYMCLTAHYIDDNWNYQKRIINFRPILSHKGDQIATAIEDCIDEWGINGVMAFTMDNATSNDVAVRELKLRLPNLIRNGMYLHVRCLAHIINLIVQDGLKRQGKTVECIRDAVKYIRSSAARLHDFKACITEKKIDTKALLSLDVCTRWNSTYDMLERAIKLKDAFDLYARKYSNFRSDLDVVPDHSDWIVAKKLAKFLELFKTKTVNASCSTTVVAHEVYAEVMDIGDHLDELQKENKDLFDFMTMISMMQAKFEKYFGDDGRRNMIFDFAVILDPRYKLQVVEYGCSRTCELARKPEDTNEDIKTKICKMVEDVKSEMQLMYKDYEVLHGTSSSNPVRTENRVEQTMSSKNAWIGKFQKFKGGGVQSYTQRTELERYLTDEDSTMNEIDFDILQWWKINSGRYPILSHMAKDILAIPVSTVASESAFSTGGRVVHAYRSSLSPNIVEALICTQDWIRKGRKEISEVEDLDKFDELSKDIFDKIGLMVIVED